MEQLKEVFEFRSYKEYLSYKVGPKKSRLGVRGAMARALNCQPTYVSQTIYGNANLSLEQAEILAEFFGLSKEQSHFFLLMVQMNRAGTQKLERYFQDQMEEILSKRLVLTERLGAKNKLSKEDQSIYYSSWQYAAIHMALTIPNLNTPQAISEFFRISSRRVNEILEFFCQTGMAVQSKGHYQAGTTQMRLGKESHNIIRHHTNFRSQAIESLERETLSELHYSGVVTLSKSDVVLIKNKLLDFIKESVSQIQESQEEEVYCLNLDWFNLKK